jgi:hypothetical protein
VRKPPAPASGTRDRGGATSSVSLERRDARAHRRARWSLVCAAALVLALVVAAAAQGSLGVVGYFQFQVPCPNSGCLIEAPGDFAAPAASAVNADGTGGASPGDLYVLDKGNGVSGGRIQQLSASDDFIRFWGPDVVKSGPGNADEAQAVRVDATGGAFKLSFGPGTTADISATATASQVESALNGLTSIGPGGVSVSGGPGDAGGTAPYLVTFDGGSLAGNDQPLLKATNGSAPLSGAGAEISAYTTRQGGIGLEVCRPADGDECTHSNGGGGPDGGVRSRAAGLGGSLFESRNMEIDQASGDLYVSNRNRIEAYSASGRFLRAWGQDVVASGPGDSTGPDEQKRVTVVADGGTFKLGYRQTQFESDAPIENTAAIPFDASPAAVETALENLAAIGGDYSSVTVSGGPGDASGANPYLITFHGQLGGDDLEEVLVSNPVHLTNSAGSKSAEIETAADGGGYEVCEPDDACKAGANAEAGGAFASDPNSIAVAPAAAPNAGNVLAADLSNNRVQEFTPDGAFVRGFGWDVDETNPSTGFEVCSAESGDACQAGSSGAGLGQFAGLSAVAGDASGAIYTVESGQFVGPGLGERVQKFTPAGGLELTPSFFGTDEVQTLTVNAGAGQFRLALSGETEGTVGTGFLKVGSSVITDVNTTTGAFTVGQPIDDGGTFRNYITAVGPDTITLGEPSTIKSCCVGNVVPTLLHSNRVYTTPDLPYNASAGEVEAALNTLPSIGSEGGAVTVTPDGPGKYLIAFDGGLMARTDPAQIAAADGATPLSGGSGADANTASVVTTIPGGPNGTNPQSSQGETNTPFDIAIGLANHVFVAKSFPATYTTCPDGSPTPYETRIEELDSSGAVIQTSDPCTGVGSIRNDGTPNPNLTVNPSTGHPYLLGGRINIFGPPGPAPSLALDGVSSITAAGGTISGTVNPNGPGTSYPDTTGTPSVTKTTYRVEYKKASEASWTKYTPDIPTANGITPVPFNVGVAGLEPKTEYELRVVAVKPFTATVEEAKSFTTLPAAPQIEAVSSANVTIDSADLRAEINPQGSETTYHFEYGTTPAYGNSTAETSIGESHSGQPVQDHIEGLQDAVYHFRLVATNASGTTVSDDQTFNFHPPVCPNQTVRQQTGAAYLPDCRAYELVSPEDAGGTVLFTGGPQSPYASNPPRLAFVGQFAAIPGAGRNPINTLGDLYIASRGASGWSSRYVGPSSEEAGCVGGRPIVSGTGFATSIQNDVMADPGLNRIIDWNLGNPMECFNGIMGSLNFYDLNTAALGSNAPYVWNANGDFLDRWPTSVADVPGSEANLSCPQNPAIHPYPPDAPVTIPVPYFCSTYVDASKDLNHFVFSTQSGLYGQGGLTEAPGSAYDNDTANNTLKLISELPGGGPIGQEPGAKAGPEELIQFPAISADGSHILMGTATKPACKQLDYPLKSAAELPLCPIITQPTHLYMRVNAAVTYDVSAGKAVKYIGATPDATKVYFTSDEQLSGDDTDQSTDLYMWSENGGAPQLTRVSAGAPNPAGNTDNCASTWTTDCDVKTYDDSRITASTGNRGGLGSWHTSNPNPGYTDNAIAAKSGDVYFYSPEQLVAGKGTPGKENLYVYRGGGVRHVATLEDDLYCVHPLTGAGLGQETCSNGAAGRLQVTPDGRFAAFVTTSNITAYDSHGFAEMYRYDAEAEKVECVSCRPDGSAPIDDVLGSQGGRFLTDDGRVFFDTTEPLDPRDTNAGTEGKGNPLGSDVYEFVDGRPQLITTGTGISISARQFIGGSFAGLYGVSADGVDVYFGTFDTLVGQDRNGQQLKFYDARTNGGFPFVPPPAPCAAADECHGPTAAAPPPIASGTAAALGAGGNSRQGQKKKHKRKQHKQRKRGSRNRAAQHRTGGTR